MSAKDYFITFIKGIIIGLSNVVTGISGSALMLSLGLYENIIDSFNNMLKNKKKHILIAVVIGILVGLLSSFKISTIANSKYHTQTILFFSGIILGGLKLYSKKLKKDFNKKNLIISIISAVLIVALFLLIPKLEAKEYIEFSKTNILIVFLLGLLSGSLLIPGVSAALILTNAGYYDALINAFDELLKFNNINSFIILTSFVIGFLVGIISLAKLLLFLLKKYKDKMHYLIMGLTFGSIIIALLQIKSIEFSIISLLSYIVFITWGYLFVINVIKE